MTVMRKSQLYLLFLSLIASPLLSRLPGHHHRPSPTCPRTTLLVLKYRLHHLIPSLLLLGLIPNPVLSHFLRRDYPLNPTRPKKKLLVIKDHHYYLALNLPFLCLIPSLLYRFPRRRHRPNHMHQTALTPFQIITLKLGPEAALNRARFHLPLKSLSLMKQSP